MVVLVRHGSTTFSADDGDERLPGWMDIPLTDQGITEAVDAAERLRDLPIYTIYSDDLIRCVQTAEHIGARLRKEIKFLPAFRTWNIGEMAGKHLKRVRDEMFFYIDNPAKKVPGGESFQTFVDRYLACLRPIVADKRLYAVITHTRNFMVAAGASASKGRSVNVEFMKTQSPFDPTSLLLIDTDWTVEVLQAPKQLIHPLRRVSKQTALYVHKPDTDYKCQDCVLFLPWEERCLIHGRDDVIKAFGTCGYWVYGRPRISGSPTGSLTKLESGYTEHRPGYTCGRCTYFLADRHDCHVVDPETDGDDPGSIESGACCAGWEVKGS